MKVHKMGYLLMIIILADIFLSSVANVCVETTSVVVKMKLFPVRVSLSRI
jgi:hypothetical protein